MMLDKLRKILPSDFITVAALTAVSIGALAPTGVHADIFEWEWINPADPSQGKQESATLVPDGAGLSTGRYVDLSGYNLTKSYLISVDLFGTTFLATNLTDADLTDANLQNADFTGAILTDSVFDGADIEKAILSNTTDSGFTLEQFQSTYSHQVSRDMRYVELDDNAMPGWDFSQIYMLDATFRNSVLAGADFTNTNLTDADMTGADLSGATLTDARMDRTTLSGADLSGADIRGARIKQVFLTFGQMQSTANYQSNDLSGIYLESMDIRGWDLSGQNLTGAILIWSRFDGADLSGSTLVNTNLHESNFENADLTGAELTGANIGRGVSLASTTDSGFTFDQFQSTYSYQTVTSFRDLDLSYNDLRGWDFTGLDMDDVVFFQSDLTGADFSQAELRDPDFREADLTNASLADAFLDGALFTDADLTGADIEGAVFRDPYELTYAQFTSTASYQSGNLNRLWVDELDMTGWDLADKSIVDGYFDFTPLNDVSFRNSNLSGSYFLVGPAQRADFHGADLSEVEFNTLDATDADFSNTDLTNASLYNMTLAGADLTGATITHASLIGLTARGFTFAQFQSTANYQSGNLDGVNYINMDLSGWDLSGQSMVEAFVENATLTGANLSGANLSLAHLRDIDFTGVNLAGTILVDSNVVGASFESTTDSGFTFEQLRSTLSYQREDLVGINLSHNNLAGWDFYRMDLIDAAFENANLMGANLMRADLKDASFSGADLTGADARYARRLTLAPDTVTQNFIHPDGHVDGLVLGPQQVMNIRDIVDHNPDPINILQALTLDPDSTLRMVFHHDTWGSTITFEPGTSVTLGGTLDLVIDSSLDPLELVGTDMQLFDWDGVVPQGVFDAITGTPGPNMFWDLSQLYTQGIISAMHLGDLNQDRFIGVEDLNLVLANWNLPLPPGNPLADPTGDGYVGFEDLIILLSAWNRGQPPAGVVIKTVSVPEPAAVGILGILTVTCLNRSVVGRRYL